MRGSIILLAFAFLQLASTWPTRNPQHVLHSPPSQEGKVDGTASEKLHGRFLHITDLHPDPFYKVHSSTNDEEACHRGSGPAGIYGAETSDCDTPFALINETFKWIENNLRDNIDFVIWTGDSARHDSDEEIPRTTNQVLDLNRYIAGKFTEVFGDQKDISDPAHSLSIPIVPTLGNNDILPHNILLAGPNRWLHNYADVWQKFIPEEQRHGFQRGGWFWVEVIPQKLAVFSLNTLYFFDHNSAVDGCALKSEPGWEHMEWLRIQLQFMRQRGMKVILMGHVPPARTEGKQLWDESCWQKYTLWLQQYRDIIVGAVYGHMNIDHFLLQDTQEIDLTLFEDPEVEQFTRAHLDDELTIDGSADYLEELRATWSRLPDPSIVIAAEDKNAEASKKKKGKKDKKGDKKKNKVLKEIGGPWGERFQLSTVGPSVVPNYFPTLRVVEYNITGLENHPVWASVASASLQRDTEDYLELNLSESEEEPFSFIDILDSDGEASTDKKKKHKKPKNPKKPKDPDLHIPPPPSKSSPPGPAYSPQTLTFLGYVQYFANLTHINNDTFHPTDIDLDTDRWHGGKHKDKQPKNDKPDPKTFKYEIEYSTFNDDLFKLPDMTVRSYLKLAHRIGQYKPDKDDALKHEGIEKSEDRGENTSGNIRRLFRGLSDNMHELLFQAQHSIARLHAWLFLPVDEYPQVVFCADAEIRTSKKHKGDKKKGHKKRKRNQAWLAFIKRAFVGTLDEEEIEQFQMARDETASRRCGGEGCDGVDEL